MRAGPVFAALLLAVPAAKALDLTDDLAITGYGDVRIVAPTDATSYVNGGLGKLRYGDGATRARFAEGVAQIAYTPTPELAAITLLRAEPYDRNVVDALEAYVRYTPAADGDVSYSVKAGAFFPAISLENDDLGWASPYTLTPSAINSWIGDELRTIGGEATLRWKTAYGTLSLIGAVTCCNDQAGIVMADRGWALDDRPTGLFERIRLPAATLQLQHAASTYARTGMFDEIDGHPGWYAGASWQMPGIVKLSAIRYDNDGDPYARTTRDTAWDTRFWSIGARSDWGRLMVMAQAMRGDTVLAGPGFISHTKFQSAFLLASYDFDDWRISAREEAFATRKVAAANANFNEDGDAFTAAASFAPRDWLRLTGELIALHSRRGEYATAGLPVDRHDTQFQFSTRFFY